MEILMYLQPNRICSFNWHSGAQGIVYVTLTPLACLHLSSIYFNFAKFFLMYKSWAWSELLFWCFLSPQYKGNRKLVSIALFLFFLKARSKLNCFLKWIHSCKENSNQMFTEIIAFFPQAQLLCKCLIFIGTRLGIWIFQSRELFNNTLKIFSLNYFVQCTFSQLTTFF